MRAKPDPRTGHGQSKDRRRGWCGPQRAARGHGPGADDASGGACLLTFRGRSVGRTNKQHHARAGVSGRQPVEPPPCPSTPCETRAPRGSPLINPPELSSPPPAEGTGRALQAASGTRSHIAKDGEPICGKVWLDATPRAGRARSGGLRAAEQRSPQSAPQDQYLIFGQARPGPMQEGPGEFLSTGLPTAAGDENPGTPRNLADCALLTFAAPSTKGQNADFSVVR